MRENDSNEIVALSFGGRRLSEGRISPIIFNERDFDTKKIGEIFHMADELLVTFRFL